MRGFLTAPLVAVDLAMGAGAASAATQLAKLIPEDGAEGDFFAWSVALDGTTALVGARHDADNGEDSGSAYLFDVATGAQRVKLIPDDGAAGDWFGQSVALSGNIALVGAPYDNDSGDHSGSAYLFDTTTGAQLAKLTPDDGEMGDKFGWSVALSGTRALVGAWGHAGAAYLFDVTTGTQLAKLTADDSAVGHSFGWSVALDGETALVGARTDYGNVRISGSAYLFDVTTASQIGKLTHRAGRAANAVALDGETALVGAPYNSVNGPYSGSAYLFDIWAFPPPPPPPPAPSPVPLPAGAWLLVSGLGALTLLRRRA